MKKLADANFKGAAMGVAHGKRSNDSLGNMSSAVPGVGSVPSTPPGGREIPGDVMAGTQREYPPLQGDFGGEAAFSFGMQRPR